MLTAPITLSVNGRFLKFTSPSRTVGNGSRAVRRLGLVLIAPGGEEGIISFPAPAEGADATRQDGGAPAYFFR
jgi:hypothetical protein